MATTTNYGWDTPDDTDLVKDGAAAIRTLGSSIDTTTKNLNPETTTGDISYRSPTANTNTRLAIGSTGQVLTVAAGVPSWATPTDQTPLTTKGDVFTFSTVDARLGVGANGTVLTADSAETTGLKWAAPSSGALTLITQASFDNPNVSVTNCFSTTYENYLILINCSIDNATARQTFLRFLASDNSEYSGSTYSSSTFGYKTSGSTLQQTQSNAADKVSFPVVANGPTPAAYFAIQVQRKASTNGTYPSFTGTLYNGIDATYTTGGFFDQNSTVYGFKFFNGTYNVAGQYRVYGYQKS